MTILIAACGGGGSPGGNYSGTIVDNRLGSGTLNMVISDSNGNV